MRIAGILWLVMLVACTPGSQSPASNQSASLLLSIPPGLSARLDYLSTFPAPERFPRCLEPTGEIRMVSSRDWTSGFFPGVLWLSYELTGNDTFRTQARAWTARMEAEQHNATTHDMGFKMNCSYGEGYRLTGDSLYKAVLIRSAQTLAGRFSEQTGCIRSWDFNRDQWQFPVIIDNMMNLELLFLATQLSGDSSYHHIAVTHALTTLEQHFRPDHSSYHVVDYDTLTGAVRMKVTHQGYADESAWARGQTWGLYGYTMAWRFAKDQRFLDQAQRIADLLLEHPSFGADGIPPWDLDAPEPATQPRDVSAACVMASALYELGAVVKNERYLVAADRILKTLEDPEYAFEASSPHVFLLKHSTGNYPKSDEIDVPIIYADYYYLEALMRKNKLMRK